MSAPPTSGTCAAHSTGSRQTRRRKKAKTTFDSLAPPFDLKAPRGTAAVCFDDRAGPLGGGGDAPASPPPTQLGTGRNSGIINGGCADESYNEAPEAGGSTKPE